jgi:hypothetical protein
MTIGRRCFWLAKARLLPGPLPPVGSRSFLPFRPCRFHLPASLCSTGVTPLLRSYERSDSCSGGSSDPYGRHEHRLTPGRSPCFMPSTFPPFRPPPPQDPDSRFLTLPLNGVGPRTSVRFRTSLFVRQLVSSCGRIRFAFATDRQFVSRCSPHRLSTAQLRSTSGRRTSARDGLPPS